MIPEPPAERPEIVFFDVGDTLLRVDPSWAFVYLRACHDFGLPVEADAVEAAFRAALKDGFWDADGPFEVSREASYQRIKAFDVRTMALLGFHGLSDAFYRHLADVFVAVDAWHVFPDTRPALEALAGAGIRRAVISNWVWGLPELLHNLDLARYFEAIVVSSRVGFQKPQPEIFRRALKLTAVEPSSAVHVGDNPIADAGGARAVGIRPILIDRGAQAGREPSPLLVGTLVIHALHELLPLVGVAVPSRAEGSAPSPA